MKRNNLLMLAYIIFVFICAIVRIFGEFPQWHVLVAGVTATSWIFSLADFNYTASHELGASSKELLELAESSGKNITKIIEIIDDFLTKSKEESSTLDQKQLDHYVRTRQGATKCLEGFEKMEATEKKNQHIADIAGKIATILTVVGFVVFFAILSFERIAQAFISDQDFLTVLAFGLILFTQYRGEWSKEQRQQRKKKADAVRDGWIALRKSFELEVEHYAD